MKFHSFDLMAKSLVVKKKHYKTWVLVLILAILSTLGSLQIWREPWQIAMSYCHFIEGHTWCPIWIPIDVEMVCHVILSFRWNPQMASQMRSHLENLPTDLKPFVHVILVISLKPSNDIPNEVPFGDCTYRSKTICHVIETHKWHPKRGPIWRLYLPI
jgi:hypothetical protein